MNRSGRPDGYCVMRAVTGTGAKRRKRFTSVASHDGYGTRVAMDFDLFNRFLQYLHILAS